ncbi:hypothetical protein ZIOFF_076110 [Zingiber officinale]|uniref:Uncharacterized protein n=1 Tax=Zingiber officinale TaxID=94328 RepID=A0A8J5E814_ZINOF|nr:hypothetical protein ZIOFF_076110 [Zingiber officinale]
MIVLRLHRESLPAAASVVNIGFYFFPFSPWSAMNGAEYVVVDDKHVIFLTTKTNFSSDNTGASKGRNVLLLPLHRREGRLLLFRSKPLGGSWGGEKVQTGGEGIDISNSGADNDNGGAGSGDEEEVDGGYGLTSGGRKKAELEPRMSETHVSGSFSWGLLLKRKEKGIAGALLIYTA